MVRAVVGAVGRMVGIDGTEWGRGRVVGTRGHAERGEVAESGEENASAKESSTTARRGH